MSNNEDVQLVQEFLGSLEELKKSISKNIIGQKEVVEAVLISIFCQGHSLLVGVPGLAKTLLVNTIAQSLGLDFNRIQFTPDLMPSDITGSEILDDSRSFKFLQGPIFANIVLADEINRTPPKTQSALLEAMQEKIVTVGGKHYPLPKPFFVLATQNPIEQEGTYTLPEAQLDRFMFNIWVDYPSYEEELEIVKATTSGEANTITPVMNAEQIIKYQALVRKIPVADNVLAYAVQLVNKTRKNTQYTSAFATDYLSWGAGPRASQYLVLGAKAHALINGKFSPDIEDVKAVAHLVLRHRIVANYKAEAAGYSVDKIISELL